MKGCLIVLGVLVAALIVLIVALAFLARSVFGSGLVDWIELQTPPSAAVGDCYVMDDADARLVDCDEPHHFEVISTQDQVLPKADGQPAIPFFSDDSCDGELDSYTGGDTTDLQSRQLHILEGDDLTATDHPTLCIVHRLDIELFEGSARG